MHNSGRYLVAVHLTVRMLQFCKNAFNLNFEFKCIVYGGLLSKKCLVLVWKVFVCFLGGIFTFSFIDLLIIQQLFIIITARQINKNM